jgi:ADP-ribosylglycohydrolase
MLGAIIGDIVGSRFEFNNHRSKEFELFTDRCFVTDDSIMTIAVAKAIMVTEQKFKSLEPVADASGVYDQILSDHTVKCMRDIGQKYPNCGYGGRFGQWMFSKDPKPYNSYGNGAAMRISPAGFVATSLDEAIQLSKVITAVTHNHPEGIKGAEATVVAIYMAKAGSAMNEIRDRISQNYYPLDFTIDEIRPSYRFNETCQETVPQALVCFFESNSFEDAIRTAISLGGDSDTIAAITGAVAEAYYGVPEDLRRKALTYMDSDLHTIFEAWEVFMGNT